MCWKNLPPIMQRNALHFVLCQRPKQVMPSWFPTQQRPMRCCFPTNTVTSTQQGQGHAQGMVRESADALAGGYSEELQVHHLQATCENIGIKEVVAPDAPNNLVDLVVPASVIAVTQETRE